jgi:hypothetical protein
LRRFLGTLLAAAGVLALLGAAWILVAAEGRTFRPIGEVWRILDRDSREDAGGFLADAWPAGEEVLAQPSSWLLAAIPLAFLLPGLLLWATSPSGRRARRSEPAGPPPRPRRVRRGVGEGITAIEAALAHSDAAAAAEARILLVDRGFGWTDAEAEEAADRLAGMVLAAPRFPQALAQLLEQRYQGRGGPAMEAVAARLQAARYVDRLLSTEPPRGTAQAIATFKRHREAARSLVATATQPAPRADVRELLAAIAAPSVVAAKFDPDRVAGRGGGSRGLAPRIRGLVFATIFVGIVTVAALRAWAEADIADLGPRVLAVMLEPAPPAVKLAAAKALIAAEPGTWLTLRREDGQILIGCSPCTNAAVESATVRFAGEEHVITGTQTLTAPGDMADLEVRLDFYDGSSSDAITVEAP